MNSKIKISIIVPIYNVEKYIKRCLNSLINQTFKQIEILIIDDKSTDKSLIISKEYAKIDNRIKIIENDKNIGAGLSRNKGLKLAKGKFIAFVDSDDFIDLDFYEKLYNKITETNSDICYANFISYENEDNKIIKNAIPNDTNLILDTNCILHNMFEIEQNQPFYIKSIIWKALYKKDIIEKNNIKFVSERKYLAEDLLFNFDYLKNSKKASFCENTHYYHCINDSSITRSDEYYKDLLNKNKNLHDILIKKANKYKEIEYIKKSIENIFVIYLRILIKQEVYNNKYSYLKNIVNDKHVIYAINNKSKEKMSRRIFDFFIKTKQVLILILICKLYKKYDKGSE